jgi:tetratricopeptide (TPR) repeat protein
MVLFQPEDRLRDKRQKAEKAINFAMQNRWNEAAELNRELIADYPNETDSRNRLGKALMELGRYREAHEAYLESLRIDPTNSIAQKNAARLAMLVEEEAATAEPAPTPVDPSLFIEETGKTVVTSIVDLADKDVLARLTAGDIVTLEPHRSMVRALGPAGERLGKLEPKLAQRVIKLVNEGNQYTAAVTAVDDQSLRIIIREVYRDPSMGDRPSFPTTTTGEAFRAYTRDTVIRYDVEDEEEDDDEGGEDTDGDRETPRGSATMELNPDIDDTEFTDEP